MPHAAGLVHDAGDEIIEALQRAVGDAVPAVADDLIGVALDTLGELQQRIDRRLLHPADPAFQIIPCPFGLLVAPHQPE